MARAEESFQARIAELEQQIRAIPAGKDGAPGKDGRDGKDGAPGPRGEKGDRGDDGAPGKNGLDGANGKDGVNGKDGAPGVNGKDGVDGKNGVDGKDGAKGDPGVDGKDGAPGVDGRNGADGKNGIDGKDGANGKDGRDGVDGKDGAPGVNGKDGLNGKDGDPGARGEKGDPGRDGKDGRDGRDGKDGADGLQGEDALEIDVLPKIDEQRSYPRGTWARHRKGLWRAAANTDGMRGWECVVGGVAEIQVEQREERKFVVTLALSDGDPIVKEFDLPVMIHRGVYRPATQYLRGDNVTYGGSVWLALVDYPTKAPGDATDGKDGTPQQWQLIVKKGAPGKDAK